MRRAACWLVLALQGLGCVSPVDPEELPEAAIAVVYWSREDARRRLEATSDATRTRLGVARIEDLAALIGARPADGASAAAERFPGHLGLVDPRTGTLERVEFAPSGAIPLAWSPDRTRLLFSAARTTGDWQLYEYDLPKNEVRPITHGKRVHPRGDYGPNGRVAHTSWGAEGTDRLTVSVTEPGGGRPRVISVGVAVESVRWSPRGDMLLLVVPEPQRRGRGGGAERMLFAASLDESTELRPLGRGRDPVFSANGDWIVYSAPFGDGWRLRRMRPDGSARAAIGTGSTRDELQPALSPDGRYVAYVAEEAGFRRLFVRRMDGTGDRLLVSDEVIAQPIW